MKEFEELLSRLKAELVNIKALETKGKTSKDKYEIYQKFSNLLYPYSKKIKYKPQLLLSIEDVQHGKIMVDDTIYKNSLDVVWNDIDLKETKDNIEPDLSILNDSINIIKTILENRLIHVILLQELVEEYDVKKYNSHRNIWRFYENNFKKSV